MRKNVIYLITIRLSKYNTSDIQFGQIIDTIQLKVIALFTVHNFFKNQYNNFSLLLKIMRGL